MTRASRLVAVVAVAAGALVAATPAAAATEVALVTQPVAVRGYTMRLLFDGDNPALHLILNRGRSVQAHSWTSTSGTLRVSRTLRTGLVRARFHGRGRLDMRFRAQGRGSFGRVPWCERPGRRVAGVLTGTLRLRTGPGLFKTIVRDRLRAWLVRRTGPDDYRSGFFCYPPLAYELDDLPMFGPRILAVDFGDGSVSIVNPPEGGTVQWVEAEGSISSHYIVARSARRVYSYRDDLSTAHAVGIRPFFTGAVDYKAGGPHPYEDGTQGTLRGNLRARLAAPGPIRLNGRSAFLGDISP